MGFHLISILNSSNSFSGTERVYEVGMKEVKLTSDRADNAPKVGFWKRFHPFVVEEKALGFSFSAKAADTHQKPVRSQDVTTPA